MTKFEIKAEEDCKIYLCRECNRIFECDGNIAFCSKARAFCKGRLIVLLQEENEELKAQIEKMKSFIHSEIHFCMYCPLTNECKNEEGTCPYTYTTTEEQKNMLMDYIKKWESTIINKGLELERQVEKIKICRNCINYNSERNTCKMRGGCRNCINWDMEHNDCKRNLK